MSKRAPPFTEQCDAGDKTLGRFIEAPQDAQTGQLKLTRIEVRQWSDPCFTESPGRFRSAGIRPSPAPYFLFVDSRQIGVVFI